jgi:hypothetical protein
LFTAAALLGPGVASTLADHEADLTLVAANSECQEEGFDFGFKLDDIDQLQPGTYTASDANHTVSLEIELIDTAGDDEDEIDDFNIISITPEPDGTLVKQPNAGGGISHITFCFDTPTTTTTTTTTGTTTTGTTTTGTTTTGTTTTGTTTTGTTTTGTTTTGTTTTGTTTTGTTTTGTTTTGTTTTGTTTGSVSSTTSSNGTGTVSETTTTGGVSGTTGTGTVTLPPTSTEDPTSGGNSHLISFGLLLLAVGSLVLGLARPLATRRVDDR